VIDIDVHAHHAQWVAFCIVIDHLAERADPYPRTVFGLHAKLDGEIAILPLQVCV